MLAWALILLRKMINIIFQKKNQHLRIPQKPEKINKKHNARINHQEHNICRLRPHGDVLNPDVWRHADVLHHSCNADICDRGNVSGPVEYHGNGVYNACGINYESVCCQQY